MCEYKEVEIIEAHAMKDHIHMLVMIPPKLAVSSFMGYLKGKSSLMIFERHANLKYKYGNRNFWAKGYFVSTVGLKDEVVREYIRNQELEDMKEDNLTSKEYQSRSVQEGPKIKAAHQAAVSNYTRLSDFSHAP